MIELMSLTNLRAAQALCDYLTLNGIENHLENRHGGFSIEIDDGADFSKAREIAQEFLNSPNRKKFLEASWLVDDHPEAQAQLGKIGFSLPSLSRIKSQWFTYLVMVFCGFVFLGGRSGIAPSFYPLLSFPDRIETLGLVEVIGFITPAFLHFSAMHIIFNLLWWWQFGGMVEREQGWHRLVLIFLLTSLPSNLAQAFIVGPNFGGLSGVVYGLLGYLWIYSKFRRESPLSVNPQIVTFMLVWLVIGYTDILASLIGPVANWAHMVGLVSGCLLGGLFAFWDNKSPSS
ncbi:MAG: rhomboid family intramembrane serine protease GlpG [Pseudomonadales bacterium]|nr:rhomboid family intramembrane serine protease GlpG [Pseudomonadales bacterium]